MEKSWINLVLELAGGAGAEGDVPVAAVVVDEAGREIGRGVNTREIDLSLIHI